MNNKIKTIKQFLEVKKKYKFKKIVLCHGAFDIIHHGHIEHLKKAKNFGDILVVSLTSDKFVKKLIKSPMFDINSRANVIKNIQIVDYVILNNNATAIEVLEKIKPDFYCKGEEYKKSDNVGNLKKELVIAKKNNIKVRFIGKKDYSSTNIAGVKFNIIKNQQQIQEKIKKNKVKIKDFNSALEKIKKLKVLVVGDAIIDLYTYIKSKGISYKSGLISHVIDEKKFMYGGALASYKYLNQFSDNVHFASIGNKNYLSKKNINLKNDKKIKLFGDKSTKNIIKEKFLSKNDNTPFKKIFATNNCETVEISVSTREKVNNYVSKIIKKYDLVLLQDFGHGTIDKNLAKIIETKSKTLSLNCQTNSLNNGNNIIGKKFSKADILSLDSLELKYFLQSDISNKKIDLNKIQKKMRTKYCYLTGGRDNSFLLNNKKIFGCESINTNARDPVGAGDIFHSTVSIFHKFISNNFFKVLLGQIAGGIAADITGNSEFPKISQIQKNLEYLLLNK